MKEGVVYPPPLCYTKDMAKMNDDTVKNLPSVDEPQDVAEVGPTPYEYLFAETAQKIDNFVEKVKENVSRNNK